MCVNYVKITKLRKIRVNMEVGYLARFCAKIQKFRRNKVYKLNKAGETSVITTLIHQAKKQLGM